MSAAPAGRPPRSLLFVGAHTLVSSVLAIGLGIIAGVIVARVFGPAQKGAYNLVLATAELLAMIVGLALPAGVTYVLARGLAAPRALLARLVPGVVVQIAVAALVLGIAVQTPLAGALLPPAPAWAWVAVLLLVGLNQLVALGRAVLVGQQRLPRANTIEVVERLVMLVLLLGMWWLVAAGTAPTAGWLLGLQIAMVLLVAGLLLRELVPVLLEPGGGSAGVRAALGFAIPAYGANLVQFLNYRLDVFFVASYRGTADVGIYTLAVSLAQMLWLFSAAAGQALLPHVAVHGGPGTATTAAVAARLALWASVAGACGLALVGWVAVPLLYGAAFVAAVGALYWLLPGVAFFAVANVLGSYIAGVGKPQLNMLVAAIGLVITVVGDLVLIPRLGIAGAAIASSVSYVATTIAIIVVFVRLSGVPLREVLLLQAADRAALRGFVVQRRARAGDR